MLLSPFSQASGKAVGLAKDFEETQHEKAEKTLLAIKELKRYLEDVEKDLSSISKKFSNKEIAHGVGFAATGIHEALAYLEIVKKVIQKTERLVAKKNTGSGNKTGELVENNPDRRATLSGAA